MAVADELRASAQRFHDLARVALNPETKLQLISLGDDYFRQADEIRHQQVGGRRWSHREIILLRRQGTV